MTMAKKVLQNKLQDLFSKAPFKVPLRNYGRDKDAFKLYFDPVGGAH